QNAAGDRNNQPKPTGSSSVTGASGHRNGNAVSTDSRCTYVDMTQNPRYTGSSQNVNASEETRESSIYVAPDVAAADVGNSKKAPAKPPKPGSKKKQQQQPPALPIRNKKPLQTTSPDTSEESETVYDTIENDSSVPVQQQQPLGQQQQANAALPTKIDVNSQRCELDVADCSPNPCTKGGQGALCLERSNRTLYGRSDLPWPFNETFSYSVASGFVCWCPTGDKACSDGSTAVLLQV
uniref:Clip domain-containing protein n=1 Tax=Macrostomum lignano TaxID=282301 RepID=A0A1I8G256_9PLAT